jgi:hypothetical protein
MFMDNGIATMNFCVVVPSPTFNLIGGTKSSNHRMNRVVRKVLFRANDAFPLGRNSSSSSNQVGCSHVWFVTSSELANFGGLVEIGLRPTRYSQLCLIEVIFNYILCKVVWLLVLVVACGEVRKSLSVRFVRTRSTRFRIPNPKTYRYIFLSFCGEASKKVLERVRKPYKTIIKSEPTKAHTRISSGGK